AITWGMPLPRAVGNHLAVAWAAAIKPITVSGNTASGAVSRSRLNQCRVTSAAQANPAERRPIRQAPRMKTTLRRQKPRCSQRGKGRRKGVDEVAGGEGVSDIELPASAQ